MVGEIYLGGLDPPDGIYRTLGGRLTSEEPESASIGRRQSRMLNADVDYEIVSLDCKDDFLIRP